MLFSPAILTATRWLLCLSLMLGAAFLCGASNITYEVNLSLASGSSFASSINGDIETDGTTGVLAQTDIVSWKLLVNDTTNPGFDLSSATSSVVLVAGSDLSATATELLFNFSRADQGYFYIENKSSTNAVCFAVTFGCPGVPMLPNGIGIKFLSGIEVGTSAEGTQVIGTATPEPSTLAFVFAGFALLVFRKRQMVFSRANRWSLVDHLDSYFKRRVNHLQRASARHRSQVQGGESESISLAVVLCLLTASTLYFGCCW